MGELRGEALGEVVELAVEAARREQQRRLLEALEELQEVTDLALSRLREARRWSGTQLVIANLPELAGLARTAAEELASVGAPGARAAGRRAGPR